MRILCLCFYFEPDLSAGSFKNSALVEELAKQLPEGSQVDVITTLPNRYASFAASAPEDERQGNIRIRRVPLPAHQSGMVDQSRSFVSYARRVMKMTASENYDLVYASSSRLMMSVLGGWVSWRKDIPFYLDIRDLFVDTIKDVLSTKITVFAMPVLSQMEKWAVRRASRVNVVSGGFIPYFQRHFPDIELSGFTNGIDQEFLDSAPSEQVALSNAVPEVLYAGNMGEGQGLHHIIPPLAKHFEGRLTFRLIGGGGRLQQLKESLNAHGCNNVVLDAPVPRHELVKVYADADILFLHLNDFDAFKKVLPSKIFEYGALGKPVWAGVGGFAADFVRENLGNAAVFPPCDFEAAVESFEELEMAVEPRNEFTDRFARNRIIERMAAEIIQTAG
ncbi:glycosyltransferase family 4 protein [Marinobacter sp. F4218]|uniref:glycosyltransferase family 4 protein n=1 Tax=Marinobacter sp. F4218 TaxID=2862868 RepID=UPI001C639233|nr:glycosyltransferase family 4 protein [Marinobacter sp. F4218]MBW7470440.1 glycosyltransferase family 4 protein [Marinobacter sp. F4218]